MKAKNCSWKKIKEFDNYKKQISLSTYDKVISVKKQQYIYIYFAFINIRYSNKKKQKIIDLNHTT